MKFRLLLYFIVLMMLASCRNEERAYVYVEGRNILSPRGEVLHLKGMNLGNWLLPEGYMFKMWDCNSPRKIDQAIRELAGNSATTAFWDAFLENYITEADIRWLSEVGVNIVRLPVNYRLLSHDDYMGRDFHGYTYLDNTVRWCRKYNIYVLIDLHAAPGGQTGENMDDGDGYPWLMVDEAMKQKTCDIWQEIARRYAEDTTVIGYNLLNEPVADYFDGDNLKHNLEPLYKRITKAIREVDENHIIFIGAAVWETDFSIFSEPFDDQLVYTFHQYWVPTVQEQIQPFINFSEEHNMPILLGESGENEDKWVEEFRELLDKNEIHWTFWTYKKMDDTRGMMNYDQPDGYDKLIKYAEGDRSTFAKVRALKDSIGGLKPEEVVGILNQFVENSKFENCYPNEGFCEALGFDLR